MEDLRGFDVQLNSLLSESPQEYIPVFEAAAKEVASSLLGSDVPLSHDIQIQLRSFPRITPLRQLSAEHVSRLVTIRGIVVSASRPRIKATTIQIMCRNCKVTKQVACGTGFGGARLPRECDTRPMDAAIPKCPLDPYMIVADNTEYIDQQRLKLQENPEAIPTGEMPRHVMLAAERYLVGTVKPGTRITVIGQYTTYEAHSASEQSKTGTSDVGIRIPYVRVLGIEPENDAADIMVGRWEPQDEEEMHQLAARHDIYKQISNSLAPAIYGSEDIKKALACQLFGGSRKRLPDGMRLRGDVNVLLLGDPSVAKSQFLKFVSQVAPIAVYTSGKGSSAAGLTASVIRDAGSGEFHLEGGALVLADGGLVCIDEFDKMREQDRVAIHEAMEQQTISIAKAGITTILNSRTSVLAAANPIFGRYDDMKTPTENIDFQTTILSRFDLIFIVRDVQDMKRDQQLAKYIINVHRNPNAAVQNVKDKEGLIEIDVLKKYVAYARSRCQPRLSDEAAIMLKNQYVSFRKEMATRRSEGHGSVIPITVRQLEAIVRLSESLARMHLSEVATVEHVEEAIRLFKVSTFQAATANVGEGPMRPDFHRLVQKVEAQLDLRVSVGMTVHTRRIVEELKARFGDENVINKAIQNKVSNMSYKFKAQQKQLTRIK